MMTDGPGPEVLPTAPRCRGGGRPPRVERGIRVSAWVPTVTLDRIIQRAARERRSVSEVLRSIIEDGVSS